MGYYSNFHVEDTDFDDVLPILNNLTDEDGYGYRWRPGYNGISIEDSVKWYSWLTDLQKLAKLYPDNMLVIERTGEESPDISRVVMKNGQAVEIHPTLVWPEV